MHQSCGGHRFELGNHTRNLVIATVIRLNQSGPAMAYTYRLSCSACNAFWPEFAIEHRCERTAFCTDCNLFVALHRIWYTTRFGPCPGCERDLNGSDFACIDLTHPLRCPSCDASDLTIDCCDHLFVVDEPPTLTVGATVEATFDDWAIHVPDLPAVPLTNLLGDPAIDKLCKRSLTVTSVPRPGDSDRAFYFVLAENGG